MSPLAASLRFAALRRAPAAAFRQPLPLASLRPARLAPPRIAASILLQARGAASSVSGKPGSQSLGHAAQNVREELGNSATDVAKSIAGGNMTADAVAPTQQTFLGVTSAVAHSVPQPYIVFGLAGALPYLAASGATVYSARQAGLAALGVDASLNMDTALQVLEHALNVQVTYGAVMLSFLGAIHWGFEFAGYGGIKGYPRLALGAAPVLYAWPTLLLDPVSALIAQWVGFTGLWYADLKVTGQNWTPKWYSQYRFYLSILVGTCIIGSLAGTSYFGPVAGHGRAAHELNVVRAQRKEAQLESAGTVPGNIESVPAGDDADAYVAVKKKEEPKKEEPKEEKKDEGKPEQKDEKKDEGKAEKKDEKKEEGKSDKKEGKKEEGKSDKEGKKDEGKADKKEEKEEAKDEKKEEKEDGKSKEKK